MSKDIAYQNKDIISKTFMENFGNKSLKVYGLDLPRVVRLLPTNLPAVEVNEMRIDNLLELEGGDIGILEYESSYSEEDKLKYMGYLQRIYKRMSEEGKGKADLRMIVIYTADVEPKQVKTKLVKSGFSVTIEPAFLSQLDSEKIKNHLTDKVEKGEALSDEELMEFIILPLTYKTKAKKQEMIQSSIELAKRIKDEQKSNFVIAGIVVFSDKFIDEDIRNSAKEWIRMTQIGRMFEQEKNEAVEAAVKEANEEAAKEKQTDLAKQLVSLVDTLVKTTNRTLEAACHALGVEKSEYDEAKGRLAVTAPA